MKNLTHSRLNRNLLAILVLLGLLMTGLTAPRVSAKEITPAAGSYSYGSTSEYSASTTISSSSSNTTSNDLAPTGQDKNTPIVVGVTALVLGALVIVLTYRKKAKVVKRV